MASVYIVLTLHVKYPLLRHCRLSVAANFNLFGGIPGRNTYPISETFYSGRHESLNSVSQLRYHKGPRLTYFCHFREYQNVKGM